jgi:hypothetical protein
LRAINIDKRIALPTGTDPLDPVHIPQSAMIRLAKLVRAVATMIRSLAWRPVAKAKTIPDNLDERIH